MGEGTLGLWERERALADRDSVCKLGGRTFGVQSLRGRWRGQRGLCRVVRSRVWEWAGPEVLLSRLRRERRIIPAARITIRLAPFHPGLP